MTLNAGGWMDPIADIASGRAAGLRTVWIDRGTWPDHDHYPDHVVVDVLQAMAICENIGRRRQMPQQAPFQGGGAAWRSGVPCWAAVATRMPGR
jgi:hypothetical protein